jgi:hypothetical protein
VGRGKSLRHAAGRDAAAYYPLLLAEAFTADEAFVTGTLAGITPVNRLDGRRFDLNENPVTRRISGWYQDYLQQAESPPADHRRTKKPAEIARVDSNANPLTANNITITRRYFMMCITKTSPPVRGDADFSRPLFILPARSVEG